MAENEEKKFERFLELLPNVRSVIIDEMEPGDRCRFTRCSKQSEREAKASKNFIYGLNIRRDFSEVKIYVIYDQRRFAYNFSLRYIKSAGKKLKIYQALSPIPLTSWKEELDISTNLEEYAIVDFKNILGTFQKTIKKLFIFDRMIPTRPNLLRNIAAEIESFNSLEELKIDSDLDIQQLFSKLRRPLNKLTVHSKITNVNFEECEQVYQVREKLKLCDGNFNCEQFIRLPASYIKTPIGRMSERDIFKFIRSWQNGTILKENRVYQWELGSNFNNPKLLKFLRSEFSEQENFNGLIEIKNFNKPEKIAKLTVWRYTLIFDTC